MIDLATMQTLCPQTKAARLALFVDPLNAAIEEFGIQRIPEFLAQTAHESGGYFYTREIWGPTTAQAGYEGRKDLGNTEPGDGSLYRGRGLIQVTGRANYAKCAEALDLPLLDNPQLLERPMPAARSAGWFWQAHGLDAITDFERLTRRINGGVNGLADRYAYLGRAKQAMEA
jgi:putative chitinase